MLLPSDFKQFLVDNNVLQVASAMTFGLATVAFIKAFVADFLMPLAYLLLTRLLRVRSGLLDVLLRNKEVQFANFAAELVSYVMILVSCFLLIQYVFRRYLGVAKGGTGGTAEEAAMSSSAVVEGFDARQQAHRVVFYDSAIPLAT
jgi:large-conductance mechanosensitive channel